MQISSIMTLFLREVTQMTHIFSIARTTSTFGTLATFAYSTSTAQDNLDQLSLFDTDCSFWVCNNSATGHICKDKALLTGDLVPSIYEIGSATGTPVPNLMGIDSKAYHAYNGRFADKGFWDDCALSNQTITFCCVGSHHQNGIAEQKIKDITLGGRTLLLHAKCMLPEYISTILWLFTIKCYKD